MPIVSEVHKICALKIPRTHPLFKNFMAVLIQQFASNLFGFQYVLVA